MSINSKPISINSKPMLVVIVESPLLQSSSITFKYPKVLDFAILFGLRRARLIFDRRAMILIIGKAT